MREFYRELFGATGGVPVRGEASAGALINHRDVDVVFRHALSVRLG